MDCVIGALHYQLEKRRAGSNGHENQENNDNVYNILHKRADVDHLRKRGRPERTDQPALKRAEQIYRVAQKSKPL